MASEEVPTGEAPGPGASSASSPPSGIRPPKPNAEHETRWWKVLLGPALAGALSEVEEEPLAINEIIEPLTRYSLVQFDRERRTVTIHRLVQQVLEDPQVVARNMVVTLDGGAAGATRAAGNPIKLSAFEDPPRRDPAPDLDADRARILAELED